MLCDELLQDVMAPLPDPFFTDGSIPCPPQDNIFDFIDSLSLHDLEIPGLDGPVPGEETEHAAPFDAVDAAVFPDLPQQRSSSEDISSEHDVSKLTSPVGGSRRPLSRAERIREKNRTAQARFRQKQKEERHKLDEQMAAVQGALSKVQETARQRQDTRVKLKKRVADITGQLLEVRNEQLEASNRLQEQPGMGRLGSLSSITQQSSHSSISHSASARGAERALDVRYPDAGGPLHASMVLKSRPGLPLYRRESMAPRSLDTFTHFQPIFYTDIVDENQKHVGGSMAAADAFRHAQAAQLGCYVDDLCSFPQMGVEVAPQVPLSFSHTVSSPECCASFVLAFVGTSLTHALCVKALEKQKGVAGSSGSCTHCGHDTAASSLSEDLFGSHRKRARGSTTAHHAHGADADPNDESMHDTHAIKGNLDFAIEMSDMDMGDLPPNATAEHKFLKLNMVRDAVQAASVAAHAGNMHVRCGANAKYPLVPAVTNVIAGALSTVAGVLEEEEIHQVCRVLLGQGENMILLAPDKTSVAGAMGPEEVEFFEQVTHHLCAIILTVGAVLRRFLKRSFGQVGPRASGDTEDLRQRLQQRMRHLTHASTMGDKLVFKHATRIIFNLTFDAISPLMAMYEVDNQTYRMYKNLRLTQPQKEQLGDLWTVWESRKRRLDRDMHRAKSLLSTLPSTLPVPLHLLFHISLLTQLASTTPAHLEGTSAMPMVAHDPPHAKSQQQQQQQQQQHQLQKQEQLEDSVQQEQQKGLRSHALESPWGSSTETTSQNEQHGGTRDTSELERQDLQCLGQHAGLTAAAAEALKQLLEVHFEDARVLPTTIDEIVDCASGPHVLDCIQFSKLCASHLMYQTMPSDIMAIAQLASMQCKRADLFRMAPP